MEPPNKGHFGMSFVERLPSSQRLKMNYCYIIKKRCPEACPLLGGSSFLRGSFIRGFTASLREKLCGCEILNVNICSNVCPDSRIPCPDSRGVLNSVAIVS